MARSTQLVILIKNIYTLWGRKRFLLPVTYFPTNLLYPFTLRVTGIKTISVNGRLYSIVKLQGMLRPRTPMYMSTHPHIHTHIMQSPSRHLLRNKNPNLIVSKPMENYQTISNPEENYPETKNHSL